MRLLAVYLDAWPYRYMKLLANTIRKVEQGFKSLRLIPVYGYTDCFKVTFLTGKYPDEHGYWVSYRFTKESRPRPIPVTLSPILDREVLPVKVSRFVFNKVANIHMFHVKTWNHISMNEINPEDPLTTIDKHLRARGMNTLFGLIESRNLSYIVVEDRFYGHKLDKVIKLIMRKAKDFDIVFVYIDEPDFWGHRYGVEDHRYIELLGWLSRIVKNLVEVAKLFRSSYIIFSDHGMATVYKFIDIYRSILSDPDYGKKYVIGIDGTFLRIFYLGDKLVTNDMLNKLEKLLSKNATLLDERNLRKFRLPKVRNYGDKIYALKEGIVLYPNFFSWLKPYGMHAYSPEYKSQHGIVIVSNDVEPKNNTIDVPGLHKLFAEVVSKL